MKKLLTLLLAIVLMLALPLLALAKSDNSNNGNGNGNGNNSNTQQEDETQNNNKNANIKKEFKAELNSQRKELIEQKTVLSQELEQLQAEYESYLAAGDTAGAEAILAEIERINGQLVALQAQIKQANNERYMIVKTMYSDEELAQFNSAAELIQQMYQDAYALGAGSVTVNNNLIKFETPPYIKGGKTIVPLRAIVEALGADVNWDNETQTITITKDNTTVVMTIGETTVYVDGNPIETTSPEITCGKTYIPLRFLSEIFGFDVTWDDDNEIIDIDDGDDEADEPVGDTNGDSEITEDIS